MPFYDRLLVVLTAGVVVSAMQILGVILVAAMLVVPVAAARESPGRSNGRCYWRFSRPNSRESPASPSRITTDWPLAGPSRWPQSEWTRSRR